MRKLSILIMALVTTSALMAADFFVDGIGYNKLGGDSVEVTSKKLPEYSGSITIPASVTYESTTYRVVQIGREAFHNCASITSITIPNSVTSIKFWAFSYCTSLTSITIPNSVTNIEHMPFFSCTSLGSINVDAANTHYASLDGVLFNYVKDSLIQYPIGNKRTTYTIPNSVTSIGYEAFSLCDSLHSIIIPNSVTSIGASAFYLCTSLRSIIIPNSVTSIGNGTFSCCSSLSSITIPNSVINIGDKAFYACSSLSSITMSNNVTSIGAEAFSSCSSLTSVSIPDSVTDIGERAFIYCSSLTSVTIGNNVSSIGWRAFFDCSSFGSITCYATMPPSCGEDCFGNVNKSIPVYIPKWSVSSYQSADGWKDFTNIQEMPIQSGICGDSVVWDLFDEGRLVIRGMGAMFDYNDVESPWKNMWVQNITFEEGVTRIGNHAFLGCQSIESVLMSSTITSIGEAAFEQCGRLQHVSLSPSLQTIETCAFQGDSLLTEVILPNSVTSVGNYAFSQCSGLQYPVHNDKLFARIPMSVTGHYDIPEGITTICGTAFDMSNVQNVSIPNSVVNIGAMAFGYCYSLDTLILGPNVKTLGQNTFYYCNNLRVVYLDSALTGDLIGNPFDFCEKLDYITIDENNPRYRSVDGVVYSKDRSELVVFPYGRSGRYDIPDSTTWIKRAAFYGCPNVDTITIPCSMTTINNRAFSYCIGLKAIELPSTLALIDTNAFGQCHNLRSIKCLATTPPRMAYQTFWYVKNLDSITAYVPAESVDAYKSAYGWKELNIQAIPHPNNVITYTASEKLPEAQDGSEDYGLHIYAFGVPMLSHTFSDGIGEITFDGDVISMGMQAFAYCEISSVTVPSSVTSFGDLSFVATQISSIDIPIGVDSIGDWAFDGCNSLLIINLPSTIEVLGSYSFRGCKGLTSIVSNALVPPTCGYYTFENVNKSIPVYVPAESVNAYKAADGWKDFTNIKAIGSSDCPEYSVCGKCGDNLEWVLDTLSGEFLITGFGDMYTYYWGDSLPWQLFTEYIKSVSFPKGMTEFSTPWAFSQCPNLTTIYWNSINAKYWGDGQLFPYCKSIQIGDSVVKIPNYLCNSTLINSVFIPQNVDTIGNGFIITHDRCLSVTFESNIPPVCESPFYADTIIFYIPCGSTEAYRSVLWKGYQNMKFIEPTPSYRTYYSVNDTTMGYIEKLYSNCEDSITVCAHAYPGYQFVQWKGPEYGTDTILSFKLYTDTVFYAEFEKMASDCPEYSVCGKCGDNAYWVLDSIAGTLTISGTGAMYDYEIAWFAKQGQGELPPWEPYDIYINKVIVEEGITRLGQNAFGGQAIQNESIQIVYLPSTLKTIGSGAFYCLDSLKYLQCDALTPPQGDNFKGTNQYAKVIVPCGTKAAYQADKYWRWFKNISDGSYSFVDSAQVCKYDLPYKWHFRLLYQSGIYADSMKTQTGCDSVYTLYFDVQDCFDPNHPQNPGYYQVSLIANPAAGGTVIGAGNYIQDTTITIYAHPNMGYRFDGWSDGVMDTIRQLHIGAHDTTLVANFTSDLYYICFRNEDGQWLQWDTLSYGEMPQYRGETPTKPSTKFYTYTFAGWWPTIKPATENATYYAYYDSVLTCVDSIVVTSYQKASELHICDFTKIIVTTTGFLDIDDSIAAKSLTFYVNNQNAAKIRGIEKLAITDVKMVVQLDPNQTAATPAKWYAFAVPFEVNLATDIKKEGAATPASYGSDFVVEYYDGALRATTQQGWVRCQASDVLQPGKFYMMAVNGTQNRWEISKRVDGTMSELYTIQAESNDSQSVNHRGWNGLGNTLWQSAVISVDDDSIPFATIYNNTQSVYEIVPFDRTIFATGSPFFVQVYRTSTVLLAEHTQQNVMARRSAMVENPYYELAFASAIDADYIATGFVSVSASKANEYIIGRDVEKMLSKEPLVPQMWIEAYGTTLAAHEASLNGKSAYIPLGLYVPAAGEYRLSHVDNAQSYDLELQCNGQTVTEENPDSWKIYLDKGTNKEYTLVVTPRKTPTSVNQLTNSPSGRITKVIKDGQLLILRDGKIYNAQGGEL